jgi:hypothetical protein
MAKRSKNDADENESTANQAQKQKRVKRVKDDKVTQEKTKRPLTSFILFSNETRDQVKLEYPNHKFPEIGKILGSKWKALTEEEKQKYKDKADKLKPNAQSIEVQ